MAKAQEYYASIAASLDDPALISGRYPIQGADERRIVADVAAKLDLGPGSNLLEIGCGAGNLLIPLSFMAARCTGVDHAAVLQRLNERFPGGNMDLVAGDFLEISLARRFDRVLVYSVVHCLDDTQQLFAFLDKALDCLHPSGRLLIGDVPNGDLKARFLASERGRRFQAEWERKVADMADSFAPHPPYAGVTIDDALMLKMLSRARDRGWHAYVLEQPHGLPFGNTREDILIVGPEYERE